MATVSERKNQILRRVIFLGITIGLMYPIVSKSNEDDSMQLFEDPRPTLLALKDDINDVLYITKPNISAPLNNLMALTDHADQIAQPAKKEDEQNKKIEDESNQPAGLQGKPTMDAIQLLVFTVRQSKNDFINPDFGIYNEATADKINDFFIQANRLAHIYKVGNVRGETWLATFLKMMLNYENQMLNKSVGDDLYKWLTELRNFTETTKSFAEANGDTPDVFAEAIKVSDQVDKLMGDQEPYVGYTTTLVSRNDTLALYNDLNFINKKMENYSDKHEKHESLGVDYTP